LDGSFILMSGFRWKAGPQGEPLRVTPFLADAYRYTPIDSNHGTWKRIADTPRAIGAAPSPAMTDGSSQVFVVGGVDEKIAALDRLNHPGFGLDIFHYNATGNQWSVYAQMPAGSSRVTTPTAVWKGQYVIISGESAAARRSPNVYAARRLHRAVDSARDQNR
jgi:N-acetylneuraminic acid mutarotase